MPEKIVLKSFEKCITMFCEVAGYVWVDLKLISRSSYVRYFEVIYTRQ